MNKAVVFDFDDTLVYTNPLFNQVKDDFYRQMQSLGLYDDDLPTVLDGIDQDNVRASGGFGKTCFAEALAATYRHYCLLYKVEAKKQQNAAFYDLGISVHDLPVQTLPHARELLTELKPFYRLFLFTQGDADTQRQRVLKSGLLPLFDGFYVVQRKSAAAFLQILQTNDLLPADCWSVGNSLRSDINPALDLGMSAIHLQVDSWDYEYEPGRGEYKSVGDLWACRKILLEEEKNESSCNSI